MFKICVAAKARLDSAQDFLSGLREDESGAGILEYTLVVGLMAVFIAGAFTVLQGQISGALNAVGTKLSTIK